MEKMGKVGRGREEKIPPTPTLPLHQPSTGQASSCNPIEPIYLAFRSQLITPALQANFGKMYSSGNTYEEMIT